MLRGVFLFIFFQIVTVTIWRLSSFARSHHLFFKKRSPHLVTHFSCLAHSAVRILVSGSHSAAGLKHGKRGKQVRWLYKLQHFCRSVGWRELCSSAGAAGRRAGSGSDHLTNQFIIALALLFILTASTLPRSPRASRTLTDLLS